MEDSNERHNSATAITRKKPIGASLRALAAYARRSPQAPETSVHSKPVDVVDPFARRRLDHGPLTKSACEGVVTLLKEEHENSASRIFSNDRDCLVPHVHSRRTKGSVCLCIEERCCILFD
jgi:hypothetical protein